MKKRIASVLVALVMVLSLVPQDVMGMDLDGDYPRAAQKRHE